MYEQLPCNLVLELEYVHSAQAYYMAFTFEGLNTIFSSLNLSGKVARIEVGKAEQRLREE